MKALSLKYSNPVLSQIQGCAIFLRYWVKLLTWPSELEVYTFRFHKEADTTPKIYTEDHKDQTHA